jgi:hypothetical protein
VSPFPAPPEPLLAAAFEPPEPADAECFLKCSPIGPENSGFSVKAGLRTRTVAGRYLANRQLILQVIINSKPYFSRQLQHICGVGMSRDLP